MKLFYSILDLCVYPKATLEEKGDIRVLTLTLLVPAVINLLVTPLYLGDGRFDLLMLGLAITLMVTILPMVFLKRGHLESIRRLIVFYYPVNTFLTQTLLDVDIRILFLANILIALYLFKGGVNRWLGVLWPLVVYFITVFIYDNGYNESWVIIDFTAYKMYMEYGVYVGSFVLVFVIFWLVIKEMGNVNRDLAEREEELKELNQNKNKFISILSHDLRGPFGSFASLAEILEEDWKDLSGAEIQEMLGLMKQQSNNLNKLLADILELSRTLMGNHKVDFENVNSVELVNDVASHYLPMAEGKSITLSTSGDSFEFATDLSYVRSVLRNLISNALKFTPNNGTVEVLWCLKDGFIEWSVLDSGVGIEPIVGKSLFSYSEVKSRNGTNNEKGTGLGLILCKEFVQRLNGEIWHEPRSGGGTRFAFNIPLVQEEGVK